MRDRGTSTRIVDKAWVVLAIGVAVGLVVGGAWHLAGAAGNGAHASARPTPAPTTAPLQPGHVGANDRVDDMTSQLALGRTHTLDGAVDSFAAYAGWLVGSPAAAADPDGAVRAIGSLTMNAADARALTQMGRTAGDGLASSRGAYRTLGYAGPQTAPTEAMVQVDAPLRLGGSTRWCIVGGVVRWTADGWRLDSIQPTEVPQPAQERQDVRTMSVAERTRTLPGLGWQLFAPVAAR
ncbi:MAG: hypothetical protein ACJ72E_06730 [Marmoricola sp.]